MRNKPIVVNLLSGPGAGKSTTAAGVYYELKKLGLNVELALEFAKDKVYEEAFRTMDDQVYIFSKQYHKLWRLTGKVDVIITDSPLLLSMYYNKEESEYFEDFVLEQFRKFDNICFFILRGSGEYHQEGRIQTEEESKEIDRQVLEILGKHGIDYTPVTQDKAVEEISLTIQYALGLI